ncbi:hypothetical protein CK203_085986 [Vitis vinifera]|uniref:Uncharacterized protein n=1 Tax=Vitis vinifera TaxID=29760 RepID=A0A438DWJ2_VITVI|nr:hypothetical protein CK203_085986 [Vitis vinifera]
MVPLGSSTIILVILILLQELNKIGAYKQTKCDPKVVVEAYTKLFLTQ